MERKAAGNMKLKINILGDVPTNLMVFSAILLCRLTCSTAMAIISPEN